MANILEIIAKDTHIRVNEKKKDVSLEDIKQAAYALPVLNHPFKKALESKDISFICECKQASPSKGQIVDDFPYLEIAKEYEKAGAQAISVLTEPHWFKGELSYLKEISNNVSIPCLRKDFTVDEYMIYEAKTIGASCVLLICAILDLPTLKKYLDLAHSLGLSAIVEAHDEEEVKMALESGAKIIGVNNRDLRTFTVDINNSARYRKMVPEDIVFISESGIKTAADIQKLRENGTNAVLIGETFMRSADKKAALKELRGK